MANIFYTIIAFIILIFIVIFASAHYFDTTKTCGSDAKTYQDFRSLNTAGKTLIGIGDCVQVGVVTTIGINTQPVKQPSFVESIWYIIVQYYSQLIYKVV